MKYLKKGRILIENIAIYTTAVIAIVMLLVSILHVHRLEDALYNLLEMSRFVQRFVGIAMLIMVVNLYKRKRMAWIITVAALIISIITHILRLGHFVPTTLLIIKSIVLIVLFVCHADFCCPPDKRSTRISAVLGLLALFGILLHELFGTNSHLETFSTWMAWITALMALLFVLRPFMPKSMTTQEEQEKARNLLRRYGQNPSSYLTLEEDKTLYFSQIVEGVVAYGTIGSTIVVNGDPICAPADFTALLDEFTEYAIKSAHNLFFLGTSDAFLEEYKKQGYGFVKCGEEARFDLEEYNITGKKGQRMRSNIHHATNAGLTVHEYKVLEKREPQLDAAFDRITREWLDAKSSGELEFSVGGVGLKEPMDKRYFYAINPEGVMQGFVVFVPFTDSKGEGYMADVTRRLNDAPGGINEKIIYEAFQTFKEEGKKWGSMGIAPLANIIEAGTQTTFIAKIMSFAYENLNNIYGFKSLYSAKKKYSPNDWKPGYFTYLPKVPTPQMIYAVVRIQNPQGILDYIKAIFKGNEKNKGSETET
ncbi:MAG: phosphatidylglycerol lysyltransferase domain-containing protein [Lachnospiraceae bacterium]|nr:phosphatidylglycerol lysyltransferase domain-containing protein [Lachnospiraceae bacterium]